MFILADIENTVRIPPDLFNLDLREVVETELNKKLANKVLINVGLCIALHEITNIGDCFVKPGDGSTYAKVSFQYIVFKPTLDEIIVGKVKSASREGVHVTLGFFDDILIPHKFLQHPSRFDEGLQSWVWEYATEDGESHDLVIDQGDEIRFRVVDEKFVDITPSEPTESTQEPPKDAENNKVTYSIKGSINEQGLGLLCWWTNQ